MNPKHFVWHVEGKVGVVTLNRPERKNPLTFDSYVELRDFFRALEREPAIRAVVLRGEGGNFCSGGDVHEIIGPLTKMTMPQLLGFTRMTGDVVKAMRHCPQPLLAAVDGVCAGAGIDEAIEMEAQAQAILMQNQDFRRAYEAFVAKQKPKFEGD